MYEIINSYDIYEDGERYLGTASVTMPTLTNLTQTISGAGLAGNNEVIAVGHPDTMTVTINFRTTTPESIMLSEPRRHTIEIFISQQTEDTVDNALGARQEKHTMIVLPKSHNLGTAAPAAPANGSGEYIVRYWVTWLDGEKVREIDPMNFKYEVNGTDYLELHRRALGR